MRRIFVFLILFILGWSFFPWAFAQALTVGPTKFSLSADPGETLSGQINLRNEMDQTMTWYSSFESFRMKGDSGEPQFTGKREGLASWIETNPSQITLGPGEGASAPFTIKVPEDADPGGHYAAIFWGSGAPSEGAGIGVVSRMAILVLLNVSGDVVEAGEVINFNANKKFFNRLPVDFNFGFQNNGTIHVKPQGEIIIKNIFGKTSEVLAVNTEGYNILPQTKRSFSASWQSKSQIEGKGFLAGLKREVTDFHFGYYKADLNLTFGEKGKAQANVGFLIIPWRIFSITILILALLLFGVTKGLKLYNRWIIAKARKTRKKRR